MVFVWIYPIWKVWIGSERLLSFFSKRGFHLNLVSDSFMPLEFSQSWEKWSKLKHEPYQMQNIDTVLKIKAKKTKKLAFQIYDVCVSRDLRYPPNVSCILKGIQSYVCSKRCKKEHTELFVIQSFVDSFKLALDSKVCHQNMLLFPFNSSYIFFCYTIT